MYVVHLLRRLLLPHKVLSAAEMMMKMMMSGNNRLSIEYRDVLCWITRLVAIMLRCIIMS